MVKTFKKTKIVESGEKGKHNPFKISAITNLLYFFISFFISNKSIYEKFFPFGVAFVAGVPYKNTILTSLGAATSYLIPGDINYSIKYIATIISIITVRWALKDLKMENYKFYSPVICTLVLFFISFPVYINGNFSSYILINNFFEALLSGIYSFFFKESVNIFVNYFLYENKNFPLIKNEKELIIISMSVFVTILGLSFLNFGLVSLGRIVSIYLILLLCKSSGTFAVAIAAVILEFVFSFRFSGISYGNNNYSLLFFPICALIVSLFQRFEKIKMAILYIFLNLILKINLISTVGTSAILSSFYESILASILFLITPEHIFEKLIKLEVKDLYIDKNFFNIKKYIGLKMRFLAESLKNIGNSLDVVSLRKIKNENNLFEKNIKNIKSKFCVNCNLNFFCWNTTKAKTEKFFENILSKDFDKNNYRESFLEKRCLNFEKIKSHIDLLNIQKNIKDVSQIKINDMKDCMVDQLKDIGKLLENTALKIDENYDFKNEISLKILKKLKRKGVTPSYVICKEGSNKKLKVEFSLEEKYEEKLKKIDLGEFLQSVSGKKFNDPILINRCEKDLNYVIFEKTNYIVKVAASQHICKNGNFCGDSYKCFYTDDGHFVTILSDGMGTGTRAAVEGTMVCGILSTLIKSCLNVEVALKITNTTLLTNPSEESLVAVDIVIIDLNTGKASFIKLGGASSIVKSNGNTKVLEESSLPIGILKNIDYSLENIKLFNEDKALVMSDGACYPKLDWIIEKVKSWKEETCKDIANYVVEKSLNFRKNEQDDDITVIALEIVSNE